MASDSIILWLFKASGFLKRALILSRKFLKIICLINIEISFLKVSTTGIVIETRIIFRPKQSRPSFSLFGLINYAFFILYEYSTLDQNHQSFAKEILKGPAQNQPFMYPYIFCRASNWEPNFNQLKAMFQMFYYDVIGHFTPKSPDMVIT